MSSGNGVNRVDECSLKKDFIRNIANKVLADALDKIPASAMSELRKRLGRAEDKHRFTIFGGNPANLEKYLKSGEWKDLVDYAEKTNVVWVLRRILEEALKEYEANCPQVAKTIREELEKLESREKGETQEITLDSVYRMLKFSGYKVEFSKEDEIIVDEPNIKVTLTVKSGKIDYTICKSGKVGSVEALLAKIEKIREI
jgi:hypothetical protein